MGRRVKKAIYAYESDSWQLEKEILFAYDGWNMIKETITDQTTTTKYYIWGLDLSQSSQGAGGIGGLLAVTDGSFTYGYTYDGNGNVGQLIDSADGSIKAHYEYDPYGNLIASSGNYADQNAYRFSTKYFDEGSNLYYYGYRYYSASLGRWISRDPIEEKGGINLYGFINNDGVNNWDYLGQYTLNEVLSEYCEKKCPSQTASCLHTCMTSTSDQLTFDLWYKKEKEREPWWNDLPRCPRKLCKGSNGQFEKPEKEPERWNVPERPLMAELLLHPGTKWSMRSIPDANMHANQCTYDGDGILLTIPPSYGTVDWYKSKTETHYYHDVEPIDLADYLDWGNGVGRRKREFFRDIVGSVIGIGRSIHMKVGRNMANYFEVRPLHAEPE